MTAVVIGAGLIVAGASWAGSYALQSPPGPDVQVHAPDMTVYSDVLLGRVTTVLDLRDPSDFTVMITPGTTEQLGFPEMTPMEEPMTVYFEIAHENPIHWSILRGDATALELIDPLADDKQTRDLTERSGDAEWISFRIPMTPDLGGAIFEFTVDAPQSWSSAGVFVPILPLIEVAPTSFDSTPEYLAHDVDPADDIYLSDTVNGVRLYPPLMRAYASVSPYDQLNPDLDPELLQPEPFSSPPLHFQGDQRLWIYLQYQDARWLREQTFANLFGGILIGLGSGLALAPVSVLLPDARVRHR